MANLTTLRWERYVPDIGDNRALPEAERLELEVATGLTAAQLQGIATAMSEPLKPEETQVARMADVLSAYVRVRGKHSINGAPVETLAQYLAAVAVLGDSYNVLELTQALRRVNSLTEDDELFSRRQSGGWVSTQRRAAAKADGATAAH